MFSCLETGKELTGDKFGRCLRGKLFLKRTHPSCIGKYLARLTQNLFKTTIPDTRHLFVSISWALILIVSGPNILWQSPLSVTTSSDSGRPAEMEPNNIIDGQLATIGGTGNNKVCDIPIDLPATYVM